MDFDHQDGELASRIISVLVNLFSSFCDLAHDFISLAFSEGSFEVEI